LVITESQPRSPKPGRSIGSSKPIGHQGRCTVCREIEAKVETQLMANLPKFRMQPHTPPFLYSSLDYFGQLKVKVGRNKTCKHYGVVFTCLNTRTIHCELAVDAISAMELMIKGWN
jgi:hypothetical protein